MEISIFSYTMLFSTPPPPVLHNFLLKHYLLPQFTLIFKRKLCNAGRGGGAVSYKEKLKSLYILTKKCPERHKNLDYWYLLYKYGPDTQNFNVFLNFMNEKFNKNAKVEKFTNMLGIAVRLIVIDPSVTLSWQFYLYTLNGYKHIDHYKTIGRTKWVN